MHNILQQSDNAQVDVAATGKAVYKAVSVAEIIKSKHGEGGALLHQNTEVYFHDVTDVWVPLLEGLDTYAGWQCTRYYTNDCYYTNDGTSLMNAV